MESEHFKSLIGQEIVSVTLENLTEIGGPQADHITELLTIKTKSGPDFTIKHNVDIGQDGLEDGWFEINGTRLQWESNYGQVTGRDGKITYDKIEGMQERDKKLVPYKTWEQKISEIDSLIERNKKV